MTTPTQMRLAAEDLGRLDWLTSRLKDKTRLDLSRTEVVRLAVRELYAAEGGPPRVPAPRKKSKKSAG